MYEKKDYSDLLGLDGFSDELLNNHFTLYAGYVTNTNTIALKMNSSEQGTPEYAEIKRRFGWEFNGMRLHELYFDNMTTEPSVLDKDSKLAKQIEKDFGSIENWAKDFQAAGAMRGIGWVILSYDGEGERLFNTWVNEHDLGMLATSTPILVMDVFEHAFMIDYGLKRADYITAFWDAVNWGVAENRLK